MTASAIELQSSDGVGLVLVRGDHDLSTADQIRQQLELVRGRGQPIVVDLTEATFIDSAVLGVLVAEHDRARAQGLAFTLAVPETPGGVRRLLELTGVDSVLPVAEGRRRAMLLSLGST